MSGAIPGTGFALTSHVGHTSGRSVLSLGAKDYWDWNVGATYTWKALTFGVSYVDTSLDESDKTGAAGWIFSIVRNF